MFAVHTWRETYRANTRLARTSCPTVYGSLVRFATGAFRGRRRALSCLENLFQIVCQCTFAPMKDRPHEPSDSSSTFGESPPQHEVGIVHIKTQSATVREAAASPKLDP